MYRIAASLLLFMLFQATSFTQAQSSRNNEEKEKGSYSLEETLAKASIEREEAKQRKLVSAAEELHTLAQDISKSMGARNQLSGDNQKKLGKIEKLAKQVRSDQGGDDGDYNLTEPPQNLQAAIERLARAAGEVEEETCKLTRHGISATLIERTNEVIALTKTIKKMAPK